MSLSEFLLKKVAYGLHVLQALFPAFIASSLLLYLTMFSGNIPFTERHVGL